VRLFSGTISVRQRIDGWTVTGIEVFANGDTVKRTHAVAGEIAKVRGLSSARVGDSIGEQPRQGGGALAFAPPTLASVVVVRPEDRPAVHTALTELAEQDPLIAFRQDEVRQELHLSLFGEVQKEVIQATLANEFGLDVELRESTPICIERLVGAGEGVERMPRGRSATHPFLAGVGLRIEPATIGSGVIFDSESQLGYLPASFVKAVAEGVDETLRQGLRGWAVTDCRVSLTHSRYAPRQSHAHQGFSKAMSSVGSDFRLLTPLVVVAALKRAGTVVCEPVHRYELEIPADVLPVTVPLLARVGAPLLDQRAHGTGVVLSGEIRAAAVHRLQQQIPHLTRGEAVLECVFHSYQPVHGPPPVRPRTDHNPLNRKEYLLHVLGRA
jgi:ribosomal protection tetracycline resistance protein